MNVNAGSDSVDNSARPMNAEEGFGITHPSLALRNLDFVGSNPTPATFLKVKL